MKPLRRWPLHPAPREGEALSSWLHRIACCYQMNVRDLLQHDLNFNQTHDLDLRPPVALLEMLAQRSGVELALLRSMTLAGWTPWLLDSLDPDPLAFDAYSRQFSVLLPLSKRPARIVSCWTAWLPKQAIRRACPECIGQSENKVWLLMWQLPLLLSCPQHGCWLEPYFGVSNTFIGWETEKLSRPANKNITKMDRRTWQALSMGQVKLPNRSIHAGLWFRLLRTVLEELNTPLSRCSSQAQDIRFIWESCGYPVRAGRRIWQPYETLSLDIQLQMLEATATAMHLIETGRLIAQGEQAKLLRPEPSKKIDEGHCSTKQLNHWEMALAAAEEAVASARHNPEAAQALFNAITLGCRTAEFIRRTQALLSEIGIPSMGDHI